MVDHKIMQEYVTITMDATKENQFVYFFTGEGADSISDLGSMMTKGASLSPVYDKTGTKYYVGNSNILYVKQGFIDNSEGLRLHALAQKILSN